MSGTARPLYHDAGSLKRFAELGGTNADEMLVDQIDSITASGTATINLFTGLTASGDTINIGGANSKVDIGGDLEVSGDETVVGDTVFSGNTQIGDAATDTLDIQADVISDINFDGTSQAITNDSSGNITLSQTGTGNIIFSSAAGIVQVSSGALDVNTSIDADVTTADIEASGAISLDAGSGSNFTVDGGNLTLSTTTSGDVDIAATGQVDIDSGTSVDILATTSFSIDGSSASNVSTNDSNLTLSTTGTTGGSVIIDANGTAGAVDIDSTGAVTMDAAAASTLTVDGALFTIRTINSGNLYLNPVATLDVDAALVDIDSTGAVQMNGTGATGSHLIHASAGTGVVGVNIRTTSTGDIKIESADDLDVDGDTIEIDATADVSIDAAAASNFTVAGANLTLSTTTSGDVIANAAGNVDVDGTNITADATAGISLDAATASNFIVSGATADLTLGARNATVTLNESGEESLDAGFTATSLIGAINENYNSIVTGGNNLQQAYAAGNTVTLNDGEGDWQITIDEVSTYADWIVQGANNYFKTDAATTTAVIGSSSTGIDIDGSSVTIDSAAAFSIDGTSASNVTVTGNNLTLSTATSGNVVLSSVGVVQVAAGALDIDTSIDADISSADILASGAVSIDAGAASNFSVAAADLTLETTTSGNVDINSAGNITADGTGISLDGTAASNFTVAGANLTLSTTTSGDVIANAAGNVDVDGTNITADATAAISLGAAAASDFTVAGANLTLQTTTSGNVIANAAGDVDVDGTNITADATAGISLDAAAASNFTVDGANLTMSTTTSGDVVLSSAGVVHVSNGTLDVDTAIDADVTSADVAASGAISLDAGAASNFSVASASLTLETTTSGDVDINSAGNITADGTGISLDGTAASNFTVTGASLTLSTVTSGDIIATAADDVDINGTDITADATAGISLDAATASNFTVSGATEDLTLGARSTTITLNEAGETSLDGYFSATSIIGALNELADDIGGVTLTYPAAEAITIGDLVALDYDTGDTRTEVYQADNDSGDAWRRRPVGIALNTASAGNDCEVVVAGEVVVNSALVVGDIGEYVFMSATAGAITSTAPSSGTVLRVGVCTLNGAAGTAKVSIQIGTPVDL